MDNAPQPTVQSPIAQQPQQSTRKWALLIVLPFAALILVAFIQIIVHFILSSSNSGSTPLLAIVVNLISVLVGVVSVIGIMLIPLWIIMLVKTSNHNKAAVLGQANNPNGVMPKSKTVAIVLAVIFGFWTWLYTYDYATDKKKFWINLVLSVLTLGFWTLVAWIWAIIYTATKPDEYFTLYPTYQLQQT